jgi:hypothetical protein
MDLDKHELLECVEMATVFDEIFSKIPCVRIDGKTFNSERVRAVLVIAVRFGLEWNRIERLSDREGQLCVRWKKGIIPCELEKNTLRKAWACYDESWIEHEIQK